MDISSDKLAIKHKKTWSCKRKRNPKRETESLLMAALNNAIRTNYIKPKVVNSQ